MLTGAPLLSGTPLLSGDAADWTVHNAIDPAHPPTSQLKWLTWAQFSQCLLSAMYHVEQQHNQHDDGVPGYKVLTPYVLAQRGHT